MPVYSTGVLDSSLNSCDDISVLKREILPLLQTQRSMWQEKLGLIMTQKGYDTARLAALCGVSEPTVRKWKKGALPHNRDMYLRIGFAAGYGLEEMNGFLTRWGKCPQLYAKSLEDSACIFILQSPSAAHTYENYTRLLEMLKAEFDSCRGRVTPVYETGYLADSLSAIKSREEMREFVRANSSSYRHAYERLYSFILAFLRENLRSIGDGGSVSFHEMAEEGRWTSSLQHCVYDIQKGKWFPQRGKIISLGIHLNMDDIAIDQMLHLAHMEPLYVKSPVEAAVKWALMEAKVSSIDDTIYPDGSSDLCRFVKSVLDQLELSEEANDLINDL